MFLLSKGDIRINSKKLEIFHNNEWGGVCKEDFDYYKAYIACIQLGYRYVKYDESMQDIKLLSGGVGVNYL